MTFQKEKDWTDRFIELAYTTTHSPCWVFRFLFQSNEYIPLSICGDSVCFLFEKKRMCTFVVSQYLQHTSFIPHPFFFLPLCSPVFLLCSFIVHLNILVPRTALTYVILLYILLGTDRVGRVDWQWSPLCYLLSVSHYRALFSSSS